MTRGEFTSIVQQSLNTIAPDTIVPNSLVYNTGVSAANTLIAQKLDDGRLDREADIITNIPCLAMERVDVVECPIVEFRMCRSLMKSKKEIPGLVNGSRRSGVIDVWAIDGVFSGKDFQYVTKRAYSNLTNRKFVNVSSRSVYYTIEGGYLYLIDSEIEVVGVDVISSDIEGCKEAGCDTGVKGSADCTSFWSKKFICPPKFEDTVLRMTIEKLSPRQVKDEVQNDNSNDR